MNEVYSCVDLWSNQQFPLFVSMNFITFTIHVMLLCGFSKKFSLVFYGGNWNELGKLGGIELFLRVIFNNWFHFFFGRWLFCDIATCYCSCRYFDLEGWEENIHLFPVVGYVVLLVFLFGRTFISFVAVLLLLITVLLALYRFLPPNM